MSPPLLQAIDLTRLGATAGQILLDRVSLDVTASERVALTGPSGAGKTLLLRSLALLDPVAGGEVRWRGNAVADADVPRYRTRVMYLGQRGALLEGTVAENLRAPFALRSHAHAKYDRDRVLAWLTRLRRTEAFLDKHHVELSGGEAQITALLRALQLDPVILLADEPTSAMDAKTAKAVESIVLDWLQETPRPRVDGTPFLGRALVWVSHDSEQSQRLATRSVCVRDGRIVEGPYVPEESDLAADAPRSAGVSRSATEDAP